jgi:RNA polymerase sigma-70 factor, ECF subfamily
VGAVGYIDQLRHLRGGLTLEDEACVADGVAAALARWPQGPLPDETFAELVGGQSLSLPRVEDLYLAWWCRRGDPAAIAAFEALYQEDLAHAAGRFSELPADELRQLLRVKLFVGSPDVQPKIREYSGAGSLRGWLRVTAVRTFIDVTRSQRRQLREQPLDDHEILGISDPQGTALRAELAVAVKKAFANAVANLEPRQRVFLRHAYVDRHTLDQIALHYSIHRTTVARTLASAREQLIVETRAGTAAAIGVDDDELASVIRALDSRIDLELSKVFDTPLPRGDGGRK